MLTKIRQKLQAFMAAEAGIAHRVGLAPNGISFIGLVLVFLSAIAYAQWEISKQYLFLATVLLLLSGFCDALDGVVARLYQQTTVFGGFLDSLLDRYADSIVYLAIIVSGLCNLLLGLIALVGALLVSYSRARGEAAGILMESVGVAERAERLITLAIASVIAAIWEPIVVMSTAMLVLAILSHITVVQRGVYVYNRLKKKEQVVS